MSAKPFFVPPKFAAGDFVVMKFGGTSVGDISRMHRVADIIEAFRRKNSGVRLVVVVSAMAGETNRLVALAKNAVKNPDSRELDVLLATGEQVSIALVTMLLIERGISAKSFNAQQAQILTSTRHTSALIDSIEGKRLRMLLEDDGIPVVAGFQGVDDEGDVTTLGRGGSDITAVALAASLKAAACYIYTDVSGVLSTDPRVYPKARHLDVISHKDMLELASLGAKVLHSRSVYFAMRYHVPLVVLSTFHMDEDGGSNGTWIVREEDLVEKPVVTGITYRLDEARITVDAMPAGIANLSGLFEALGNADIFVDMITQTVATDNRITVSFTVPDESSAQALNVVRATIPSLGALGASIERDIAKVSVVGVGMKYHTGVAAKMFKALSGAHIDVQMIATSETNISVLVARKFGELAVRSLHKAFIDSDEMVTTEVER